MRSITRALPLRPTGPSLRPSYARRSIALARPAYSSTALPASSAVPAAFPELSGPLSPSQVQAALDVPPSQRPGARLAQAGHAVVSTFDLFSVGVGPSSSHTVGPMRAAKIFAHSLPRRLHGAIHSLKASLHGSLAATGMGHMTPHAVLLGLMGEDPESVEVGRLARVMDEVRAVGEVELGLEHGKTRVRFDLDRDLTWHLNPLPAHPNGLRFTVFDGAGDMLATNEYFSVGGGFVVNSATQTAENLYYRDLHPEDAAAGRREQAGAAADGGPGTGAGTRKGTEVMTDGLEDGAAEVDRDGAYGDDGKTRLTGRPKYLFATAEELLDICRRENLTIAQVVWENEAAFRTDAQIRAGLLHLWSVMDTCIRNGVTSTEPDLPGGLNVRRRAPGLYRRLQTGFYPTVEVGLGAGPPGPDDAARDVAAGAGWPVNPATTAVPARTGREDHALRLVPPRRTPVFPGIEYLSCMAIAVNEVNASGGRVVTAPTNGAAGVIPATLKYVTEFVSHDDERDVMTFLLTAAAVGMLFKRGATISAAEGGCMAEVGVACSMAAAGMAACLGAEPGVVLAAAEIGIEHNLGLTCDPLGGLVQVPCIERNALGAVKAVAAAQLALASASAPPPAPGTPGSTTPGATREPTVSLDDAIEACRTTALDMHAHYKETSLAGLATTVKIPLSSPAC
ncbi:hypothetical protein Q5752_006060 [Cryptotrichosporon argae]